jgi:hypothetical protein
MPAYFPSIKNRRFTWRVGFSMIFSLAATALPLCPTQVIPKEATATKQAATTENAVPVLMSPKHKYNCFGKQVYSKEGQRNLERAIADALQILKGCKSCQQMFDRTNPNYAIDLLERLDRDKVFIISSVIPRTFLLGRDHQLLRVSSFQKFNKAAAATLDLASALGGRKTGEEMRKPCIYINPDAFIVSGKPAEDYALYGLEPAVQRAIAILHELGHVAGILPLDNDGDRKSAANTDCVRLNCISCEAFHQCDPP